MKSESSGKHTDSLLHNSFCHNSSYCPELHPCACMQAGTCSQTYTHQLTVVFFFDTTSGFFYVSIKFCKCYNSAIYSFRLLYPVMSSHIHNKAN